MTTQVHFTLDEKIKKQALCKAKRAGISFSAYLRQASREFVEGDVSLVIVREENLNKKTRAEHQKITKDLGRNKNLSPVFSSGKEMDDYLDAR